MTETSGLSSGSGQTADPAGKTGRRARRWAGYRSYQYLRPDADYQAFSFVPAIAREPRAAVTWDDETEQRATRFERDNLIVSAHDHLSLRPADPGDFAEYRRQGRESLPYEGIAASGVDLFFDGGPAAVSMIRAHAPWDWDDAVSDLGMRQSDIDHQDMLVTVRTVGDIARARAGDQVGIVLTLEAATPVGADLDRLDILYGLGVRAMGLVYSTSNQFGGGLGEPRDAGLTRLGARAVRRMNDLGMIVDASHCGDQTTLDIIECSDRPVAISHAGARALWPISRLKPDDVIRACAESGGFIGIEAAPHSTQLNGRPGHDLEAVMRHLEYCLDLVGPDHVALGPDTNFGDHVAWHRAFYPGAAAKAAEAGQGRPVEFVLGAENPGESVRNMIRWLFAHGYPERDIAKVAGGNVMRVISAVWAR